MLADSLLLSLLSSSSSVIVFIYFLSHMTGLWSVLVSDSRLILRHSKSTLKIRPGRKILYIIVVNHKDPINVYCHWRPGTICTPIHLRLPIRTWEGPTRDWGHPECPIKLPFNTRKVDLQDTIAPTKWGHANLNKKNTCTLPQLSSRHNWSLVESSWLKTLFTLTMPQAPLATFT